MSWLTFAYALFAVALGFFAGYYFVIANLLRNDVIELNRKLNSTYEFLNFLEELSDDTTVESEE